MMEELAVALRRVDAATRVIISADPGPYTA